MNITVLYAPAARQVREWPLTLSAGATVNDALQHSGVLSEYPELDLTQQQVGVWGQKTELTHLLQDGDRVEIYRPLRVDPKVARRERFNQQGSRGTGLFIQQKTPNAMRKSGSKSASRKRPHE